MDERVLAAMQRWPNVPAAYGWLRLDEAGRWRLEGQLIGNRRLIEFIGRNYLADEHGAWYFQNGPQQVFVELDYAPWVLHVDAAGRLRDHLGDEVTLDGTGNLDEEGNLLLGTTRGAGLVAGPSLLELVDGLRGPGGAPLSLEVLADSATEQSSAGLSLIRDGQQIHLQQLPRAGVPAAFGFIRLPGPA